MRPSMRMAVVGVVLCGFVGSVRAADQNDVHAIVDKAIKAAGGEKALMKRHTMTWTMKGTYYGMGDGLPFTANYALHLPNQFRFEIAGFMTRVVNGDHGWSQQNGDTTELTKDQLAEAKEELYLTRLATLLPLKHKGYELSSLGDSKIAGHSVVGIEVKHKGHRPAKLYFDSKTGRLFATAARVKSFEDNGNEVDQQSIFSDVKDVDGVPYPTKLTITRGDNKYVEGDLADIKFVKQLPAKDFEKPE